ncbi:MAG: hypothetical protein IPI78_07540 [Chitinophagaceae bacterium]|nr:hypothetical protein [Chitinophagaceae bacterium]
MRKLPKELKRKHTQPPVPRYPSPAAQTNQTCKAPGTAPTNTAIELLSSMAYR